MSEITKCTGGSCPLKEKCFRYKAKSDPFRQSWIEPPFKDGKCNHFWKMRIRNEPRNVDFENLQKDLDKLEGDIHKLDSGFCP